MHSFIYDLLAALRSPACRKAFIIVLAFISAFGLLQAILFFESPVAYAEGASEVIGCSTAYYQALCPANSDTAADGSFESRPLSIDEHYFYHFLPTDDAKTLTEPYTLTKGDNTTFEVTASTVITGLGTAESAAIGSDLQGQYLYLIINDKTALINKETLEWEIVNFAFGQTNIVQENYIYSLKADGVYKYNAQSRTASKLYTLEIIVDKESTARMFSGCARFLIRKDGVLKIAVFDAEAEAGGSGTPLSYIELEDQSDCDCMEEGMINYLIGITPSGKVVSASRNSAKHAFVRAWDAEGHKLCGFDFDLYTGFNASSGVFPVYDHEKEISFIYTTSYGTKRVSGKTYYMVSMILYPLMNNPDPITETDTNSFVSNRFDRPLYAVYTNDGSVIAARGCIWKNSNASVRSLGIVIHCEEGAASSLGSSDTLRKHLEYSYTNDHGIWVMTSNKSDGEFLLFRVTYDFEFTDNSARPYVPPEEEPENNEPGNGGENGGEGGGNGGQGEEPQSASVSAIRWRLHRAY